MLNLLISVYIVFSVLATNYKFVAYLARLGNPAPSRLGTRLPEQTSGGLKKVRGRGYSKPSQNTRSNPSNFNSNGFWSKKHTSIYPQKFESPREAILEVFGDNKTAIAVAMAESHMNCKAISKTHDYGLFQINKIHLWRFKKKNLNPFNCYHNALVAYEIYKERGWSAWSVYRNRKYKKFLSYGLKNSPSVKKREKSSNLICSVCKKIVPPVKWWSDFNACFDCVLSGRFIKVKILKT